MSCSCGLAGTEAISDHAGQDRRTSQQYGQQHAGRGEAAVAVGERGVRTQGDQEQRATDSDGQGSREFLQDAQVLISVRRGVGILATAGIKHRALAYIAVGPLV